MPLATDPKAFFEYVLETDRKGKKAEQPTFVFRRPTLQQWKYAATLRDNIDKAEDVVQVLDEVIKILQNSLVGWRNMKSLEGREMSFAPERLEEILNLDEVMELLHVIVAQGKIDDEDKKK